MDTTCKKGNSVKYFFCLPCLLGSTPKGEDALPRVVRLFTPSTPICPPNRLALLEMKEIILKDHRIQKNKINFLTIKPFMYTPKCQFRVLLTLKSVKSYMLLNLALHYHPQNGQIGHSECNKVKHMDAVYLI